MISDTVNISFVPGFTIDISGIALDKFGYAPRNFKILVVRRNSAWRLIYEVSACKVYSVDY